MCLGIHARQPLAFQVSQTIEAARRPVILGALFTMNLASALDVARIFCCFVILNIPPVENVALPSKSCHARRTTTSSEHVMRKNTCTQAGDVDGGILPPTVRYSEFVFFCFNLCSSCLSPYCFPFFCCVLPLFFCFFVVCSSLEDMRPAQVFSLHSTAAPSPTTTVNQPLKQRRTCP